MPCDTIQTSAVDLQNVMGSTLADAMRAAGWSGDITSEGGIYGLIAGRSVGLRFDVANHKLYVAGTPEVGNATAFVKRTYAGHLLKTQAARYGWRTQTMPDGRLMLQR